MENKHELLPCPFCGAQPMVSEKSQSVYCKNALCPEVIAGESDNIVDAIEGWNTRPDHSGDSSEMVKLKAQVEELSSTLTWANTQMIKEHFGDTISESQMRYEIAKDCVSATLSRTHIVGGEIKDVVGYSIRVADELISQLKQQNDEK